MQFFRRLSLIRPVFRFISSKVVDVDQVTTEKELNEINKLMKLYNTTNVPMRTVALFEWMSNIIDLKPDFNCYLNIIRACREIDNLNMCKKLHQCIDNDTTLSDNEYNQLQIKLMYMYAKIKNIELAEQLFYKLKSNNNVPIDIRLFGTMFKGYNLNGQPEKTVELYENEILNKKNIELDAIAATCLLSACSYCHRLDIGEYVHDEVLRLDLLKPLDIRLITAIMSMYCACGSVDRAHEIFDQIFPAGDHVTYSTLMKAYLSVNQPAKVLHLYEQVSSSSIVPDSVLYSCVIDATSRIGLMHQSEYVHRSIPSHIIEYHRSLTTGLIDMHAHCSQLNEAERLFHLLNKKDSNTFASLLHGYAINGQGLKALELFDNMKHNLNFNENVYKSILYACEYTGDLVQEAEEIYKQIPDIYKTLEVTAIMASIFARAKLFDEVESFIHQNKSSLRNISLFWSPVFLACYHSSNFEYARAIYDKIIDDPLLALLFSDMSDSVPSNDVVEYFQQQPSGICWTEILNDDKTKYVIHEFEDNRFSDFSLLHGELNQLIQDLKTKGVNWERRENDLKELYCGHHATRLAIVKNLVSNLPQTPIHLTKTKPTCSSCHEGLKQISLMKQSDIILRDETRVHHFHNGKCSCNDQF